MKQKAKITMYKFISLSQNHLLVFKNEAKM